MALRSHSVGNNQGSEQGADQGHDHRQHPGHEKVGGAHLRVVPDALLQLHRGAQLGAGSPGLLFQPGKPDALHLPTKHCRHTPGPKAGAARGRGSSVPHLRTYNRS